MIILSSALRILRVLTQYTYSPLHTFIMGADAQRFDSSFCPLMRQLDTLIGLLSHTNASAAPAVIALQHRRVINNSNSDFSIRLRHQLA